MKPILCWFTSYYVKSQEIEKKQEDLKQGNTDLRKEINQRKLETKNLKEDLDNNNRQIQLREKEIEGIMEQLLKLKVFTTLCSICNGNQNLCSGIPLRWVGIILLNCCASAE